MQAETASQCFRRLSLCTHSWSNARAFGINGRSIVISAGVVNSKSNVAPSVEQPGPYRARQSNRAQRRTQSVFEFFRYKVLQTHEPCRQPFRYVLHAVAGLSSLNQTLA